MDQENRPVRIIKPWRSKEIDALRQELLELEEEVAELEKAAQNVEPEERSASLQELQHAMNYLANTPDPDFEDEAFLDNEIKTLRKKLALISTMSGVNLKQTTSRIQGIDYTNEIVKSKQVIEGSCNDVEFTLEIVIEQSQNLDKKVSKITEFLIDIGDWPVKEQLQPVIARLQDELEVGRFFEVLPAFMTEFDKRKKMFVLLKKQFNENIRLPDGADGETVSFGDNKNSMLWAITWTIEVDQDYKVSNAASLEVSQLGKPSKKKARLENLTTPEQFSLMVDKVGVEKAIEAFVRQFKSVS